MSGAPACDAGRSMKTNRVSVLFVILGSLAWAEAAPVDARLTAVTVYPDRALTAREVRVELVAGVQEVEVGGLPATLQEEGLQVSGRGTVPLTILDATVRRKFVEVPPDPRVRELSERIAAVRRDIREVDDGVAVLTEQRAFLQKLQVSSLEKVGRELAIAKPDPAAYGELLAFLEGTLTRNLASARELELRKEGLQRQVAVLEAELAALGRPVQRKVVPVIAVRVSAERAGEAVIGVTHGVLGASWAPAYDARFRSAQRVIDLGSFAVVRQSTGEDWNGVALTLSTARPALGGSAPEPRPRTVRPYEPVPVSAPAGPNEEARRSRMVAGREVLAAEGETLRRDKAQLELADASLAVAAVDWAMTSAVFRVATPVDLKSDNSPQRVPLGEMRLTPALEHRVTPEVVATAFLNAKAKNTGEGPLLAGDLSIFLDEAFAARGRLATVMPGAEFDLALGADESIEIKREAPPAFREQTGLMSSGVRVTREVRMIVHNHRRTAEKVVVREAVPVSEDERIVVKLASPGPREAGVVRGKDGVVAWTVDLAPGEKRELLVKYTVEHPANLNVEGID